MNKIIIALSLFIFISCQNKNETIEKEDWVTKPINEWPKMVLTNTVSFKDTNFINMGNAFLVNTGYDTFAVTCKHIFMLFRNEYLQNIDLGDKFISWKMNLKNEKADTVLPGKLINSNKNEPIGEFNTLKNRDWIIFNIEKNNPKIYPLKIRTTPIHTNEIVYTFGFPLNQTSKYPTLVKMQVINNMGNYFYINALTENADPKGRSGSPVIDKNGYLVGLVSGAEGKLGVIASVKYLKQVFNDYNIKYK